MVRLLENFGLNFSKVKLKFTVRKMDSLVQSEHSLFLFVPLPFLYTATLRIPFVRTSQCPPNANIKEHNRQVSKCLSACQCSSAGSLHTACHLTTGKCSCKDNVEGHNCDSCKDGTYNLDTANHQGCLHCFGYGRALTCKSAQGFVASAISSHFVNETGEYLLLL